MTAMLRLAAENGAAPVAHVLCTRCATDATGTVTLTGSQFLRIAQEDAVIVVRTLSATLRGPIKVLARIPVAMRR